MTMKKVYRITEKTVSDLNYNFIFCPRNRRRIFTVPGVKERFTELVYKECERRKFKVSNLEIGDDYVLLSADCLPDVSPADVMKYLKKATHPILEEFPEFGHIPNLWTRNFFVSTSKIDITAREEYISMQRK